MTLKRKLIISAIAFFISPSLILINEVLGVIIFLISFGFTIYYTFIRIKLLFLSLISRFKKKQLFVKKEISNGTQKYIDDFGNTEINSEIPNRYSSSNTKPTDFYNSNFLPGNIGINCSYPKTTPRDNDASCFLYLSICPHCGFNFEKIVTRKRKCPKCKNDIYRNRFPNERCMRLIKKDLYDEMQKEWNKVSLIERSRISNEELSKIQNDYIELNSIYKILEKILLSRIEFFKLNYEVDSWHYGESYNSYSDLLLNFGLEQKLKIFIKKAEHDLITKEYINFLDNILKSGYGILEKEYLKTLVYKRFNKAFVEISNNYKYYISYGYMIDNLFNIGQLPRLLGYNGQGTPDDLVIIFLNEFKEYCENGSAMELYSIVEYLVYSKFFNKEIQSKNPFIDAIRSYNID